MTAYKLHKGDCLNVLRTMPDNSVDAVVIDPPYELGFMGKGWDSTGIAYSVEMWQQVARVLKPGGYLLSFGGSRTYHRMTCAIEDAGLDIRDQIMWLYGSGFPKSLDISKAIDKAAGAQREVIGKHKNPAANKPGGNSLNLSASGMPLDVEITAPATADAIKWDGWGTALKPAHEPIAVARKPLGGKTVADNVLEYGTGGMNLNASRIGERFPANVIIDRDAGIMLGDPARFFYCAKASKNDRNEGLDHLEAKEIAGKGNGLARTCATCGAKTLNGCNCPNATFVNPKAKNHHPTVKPIDLMRYLVRLITPPGGTVLDPFTGSGSTGKAAVLEGFNFIGIEQSTD